MATLLQVRDALERVDMIDLEQLCHQLQAPPPLVEAILEQMIALGKVERVIMERSCCEGCQHCAQVSPCGSQFYRLSAKTAN